MSVTNECTDQGNNTRNVLKDMSIGSRVTGSTLKSICVDIKQCTKHGKFATCSFLHAIVPDSPPLGRESG